MPNEYISKLESQARKKFLALTKEQEKRLIEIYNTAGEELVRKYEQTKGEATKWLIKNYVNQLYEEQNKIISKYGLEASSISSNIQRLIMEEITAGTEFEKGIAKMFSGISKEAFDYVMSPEMYTDGKTLSERIWNISQINGFEIQNILTAGIARGASSTELAEVLSMYVIPEQRKYWDRNKIIEILGEGYGRKYKELEYNALRLARTTMTHAYQMGTVRAAQVNPFTQGLKWHISPAHSIRMNGKTDICDEYNGKVFPIDKCPFDHPNGLCYQTVEFGNKSLEDMAGELMDWINGGNNSKLDEWYNDIGKDLYKGLKKKSTAAKPKTKKELPKANADKLPTLENLKKRQEEFKEYVKNKYKKKYNLDDEKYKESNQFVQGLLNHHDFRMRIPNTEVLENIINEGRFKNQLEVQSSRGLYDPYTRKEVSKKLFGSNIDKMQPKDFEKYGYLGDKDLTLELDRRNWMVNQYGDIIITFKKESLYNRTTFTMKDSLSPGLNNHAVAGKVDNAQILDDLLYRYDEKIKEKFISKGLSPKDVSMANFIDLIGSEYLELQYHGDVVIDDIESITILENEFLDDTLKESLVKKGIKIFRLVKEKGNLKVLEIK